MLKIKFARFHAESNFIPEIGEVGSSLPSPKQTLADLSLWMDASGLVARFSKNGKPFAVLFPSAAVKHALLDTEDFDKLA